MQNRMGTEGRKYEEGRLGGVKEGMEVQQLDSFHMQNKCTS